VKAYRRAARSGPVSADNVAIPFKLRRNDEVLSFISTTMVFGTPVDITLQELALETFFPADDLTAERMRQIAAALTHPTWSRFTPARSLRIIGAWTLANMRRYPSIRSAISCAAGAPAAP